MVQSAESSQHSNHSLFRVTRISCLPIKLLKQTITLIKVGINLQRNHKMTIRGKSKQNENHLIVGKQKSALTPLLGHVFFQLWGQYRRCCCCSLKRASCEKLAFVLKVYVQLYINALVLTHHFYGNGSDAGNCTVDASQDLSWIINGLKEKAVLFNKEKKKKV